jgi:carbonic anhydrase/acetyltransferase-like protein (isoleucine patch superfamily)
MIRPWKGRSPVIDPEAFVSEFAYVIGDVEIGAGSSVWPGSVVRGDVGKIVIGRNTCIQDNSTVHCENRGAVIGDDVLMGHNVLCHADRVEDGASLGNGAIVNGGVEIGGNSIVAAGAVVLDGTKIPPNSFVVGIPATVKGQVTEAQADNFRRRAHHYAELAKEYLAQPGLDARS